MSQFGLSLEFDAAGRLSYVKSALWSSAHLLVETGGMHPSPRLYRRNGKVVLIHGHPILAGRRDDSAVLDGFAAAVNLLDFARSLDGSFLLIIHDPERRTLTIINDRFAGFPLYFWNRNEHWVAGTSFRRVLSRARASGGGNLDVSNILTFLWLRRLLGEGTLVQDVTYLRSAAVLAIGNCRKDMEIYWQPSFQAPAPRGDALVSLMADALREAVSSHMSDGKRVGLLLSGGLDSRALLAAAPQPPKCFTTCLTRNNEFAVAAEVASIAGADHYFLPRPLGIHDGRLDEATDLSGMQVYNEAQFLGYGPAMTPISDVVMIGLGLDIFFGGLYLPKAPISLAGHNALHHRLLKLPNDLAGFYLRKVKYRLKTSDPAMVLTSQARTELDDRLRSQVQPILERGRRLGASGYGLWEYMHLHNLSRHYSFPMMESVRTFAECRAPALSNRIFDLAIALNPLDKLDGTPYQRAVTRLSPRLMAVRNANTNFPACWSLRRQTAAKVLYGIASKMRFKAAVRNPSWHDRSWPLPRVQLEASAQLMESVRLLPQSPGLASTGIIDPAGVHKVVEQHISGEHDHTILLNLLLTLSSVLRPNEGR